MRASAKYLLQCCSRLKVSCKYLTRISLPRLFKWAFRKTSSRIWLILPPQEWITSRGAVPGSPWSPRHLPYPAAWLGDANERDTELRCCFKRKIRTSNERNCLGERLTQTNYISRLRSAVFRTKPYGPRLFGGSGCLIGSSHCSSSSVSSAASQVLVRGAGASSKSVSLLSGRRCRCWTSRYPEYHFLQGNWRRRLLLKTSSPGWLQFCLLLPQRCYRSGLLGGGGQKQARDRYCQDIRSLFKFLHITWEGKCQLASSRVAS